MCITQTVSANLLLHIAENKEKKNKHIFGKDDLKTNKKLV